MLSWKMKKLMMKEEVNEELRWKPVVGGQTKAKRSSILRFFPCWDRNLCNLLSKSKMIKAFIIELWLIVNVINLHSKDSNLSQNYQIKWVLMCNCFSSSPPHHKLPSAPIRIIVLMRHCQQLTLLRGCRNIKKSNATPKPAELCSATIYWL